MNLTSVVNYVVDHIWLPDCVLDLLFGAPEPFEFKGSTTPNDNTPAA